MARQLYYVVFNTTIGWVGLLGSDSGLLAATPPQSSAKVAKRRLGDLKDAVFSAIPFIKTIEHYRYYLAGRRLEFSDELDLASATDFQRQVWRLTRLIPYGETRSYGWLAARLGKKGAGRAVGQALARNPLPVIIPCHRVVAGDGKLGGYSGGVAVKRALLRLEARR